MGARGTDLQITDPDQTVTLSVTGLLSFVFDSIEVVPDVEIHEDGGPSFRNRKHHDTNLEAAIGKTKESLGTKKTAAYFGSPFIFATNHVTLTLVV